MLALLAVAFVAPPQTVILTYHDMVPGRDGKALWFDCTPAELESQLDWLASEGASFVSLKQVEEARNGLQALPPKAVAVTFADNYLGFKKWAWPILEARGVPVTMFVHTGFVGSKQGRPKMSWEDLVGLSKSGLFAVASQTVSHPADLTRLSDAELQKEFLDSKAALEGHGLAAGFVAYPNGKFDGRVARFAQEAGYRLGFTEAQRPAEEAPDDWRIPRWVHTKYREAWNQARRQGR